jgi:hypothetical protein
MSTIIHASWKPVLDVTLTNRGPHTYVADQLHTGYGPFATLDRVLSDGMGPGKARHSWHEARTLDPAKSELIDLAVLKNSFGHEFGFTLIKWFLLRLAKPAAGDFIVIGGADKDAWFGPIGASAKKAVFDQVVEINQIDGWPVTETSHVLKVLNPRQTPIEFDIVLAGE